MAQTTEPVPNKKNKALPFLAISFAIALFYVLFLRQQLSNQEQLLVSFESQVDSLISDIEDASRQRLKLENHLEELQRQLRDENDRLVSANQLLNEAEAKVDPDYDELEAAAKRNRPKILRYLLTLGLDLNHVPGLGVVARRTPPNVEEDVLHRILGILQ